MKRTIKNLEISFESRIYIPGFQNSAKTLKTSFKNGDKVDVNESSSGIGVKKDGILECWIGKDVTEDMSGIGVLLRWR